MENDADTCISSLFYMRDKFQSIIIRCIRDRRVVIWFVPNPRPCARRPGPSLEHLAGAKTDDFKNERE